MKTEVQILKELEGEVIKSIRIHDYDDVSLETESGKSIAIMISSMDPEQLQIVELGGF